MSFQAKNAEVLDLQLKIQEVVVRLDDKQVLEVDGSDLVVKIEEPLKECLLALKVEADGTLSGVDSADISLESDDKHIRLASQSLAAGDKLLLKYITK
jgi:hypothetical protein